MDSDKSTLKRNIQEWLTIGEEYNSLLNKMNNIRKQKNEYENLIISSLQEMNLSSKTLLVNNSQVKMRQSKQFQTITLQYLNQCLSEFLQEEEVVNEIMDYIKNSRSCKIKNELKIV